MKVQNDTTLSRRDFIATTALGAMGVWRGMLENADSSLLYVGTYTEGGRRDGIYLVRMDSATGALRRVAAVDARQNPAVLAIPPNGRNPFPLNQGNEKAG